MTFELFFDAQRGRFVLKTFGQLQLDGITNMIRVLLTHPKWQKGRDLLVDHRQASFSEISTSDMAKLSEMVTSLDRTLGARRCAVVSPEDGYTKHAMYKYDIEPNVELETQLFFANEYDDATSWLDRCH